MRCCRIIALSLLCLICSSCGENKSPEARSQPTLAASPAASGKPVAQAANSNNVVMPPGGAQWTIYCVAIPGPGHVERAKEVEDDLNKSSHMQGWYLVHEDDQSTLYFGYYKTADDPQLKADRQRIAQMTDQAGNRPFQEALPVPIASPDPTAPPEYNLANAKGYWSLEIASYDGPGRKEAAVESVIAARKMGVEAYYYHGPSVSEVCIGAWPEEAIKKQDTDTGSAENQDQPILVLGPGGHLPDSVTRGLVDKDTHKEVRVLEQKVDVLDPTMMEAMHQYPTHSVNGNEDVVQITDPSTGKVIDQPKPSFIVQIPHQEQNILDSAPPQQPQLIDPDAPSSNGLGKLR